MQINVVQPGSPHIWDPQTSKKGLHRKECLGKMQQIIRYSHHIKCGCGPLQDVQKGKLVNYTFRIYSNH